ncbi:hypothetical protein C8J56DRAFT_784893 [Mycena floridula]|nr:hypothetical protein C8J56DRAFT_784893 [Mycena floridula]
MSYSFNRISNTKGCNVVDCPVDLIPNCPDNLKGPFDNVGSPVGCQSSCVSSPFAAIDLAHHITMQFIRACMLTGWLLKP